MHGSGMGPAWRHLRSDRSAVDTRLDRGTLRRVLTFARPHRRLISVFIVLTVVDAGLVVVNPLLVQRIVDHGILPGDARLVTLLALAMAGIAILGAGLAVVMGYLSSRIGEGLIYDLRTQVFGHVQRQSLAFFTRTQTGALVSRLNNDVIGAQRAFTSTLSNTVSNTISVVVVGIAMLALSWRVTLLCLLFFPIALGTSRWVGGRLSGLTRQQMDGNADMGAVMTERFNVGGAMLLKLFGRREEEDQLFASKAAVVRDLGVRISLVTRIFGATMMTVPALATAVVYGLGGRLAIDGTLTVGTVLALATLLLRLLGPLQGLSNVRIDVMTALVSFERVFEVLDLPSMVQERAGAVAVPPGAATLEFDHVDFAYPRSDEISLASLEVVARRESRDTGPVLTDVSFRAEPGQMVALVGPSGAGKTTVTHLVARLYDVSGGAVRVGGLDVRDVTLQSLEDAVGYVTQDAHMFHDSVRANLLYARPSASDEEIWAALEAAQIAGLVRALPEELDTVVGDRGYRLSGGERQRLAIARVRL
ncbi:MAG: ABC transporter ATP-binding protein [Nocardioides sp.]